MDVLEGRIEAKCCNRKEKEERNMTKEGLAALGVPKGKIEAVWEAWQKELEELAGQEELEQAYQEKWKTYLVKAAIKEAGGKNEKAILALVDLEKVTVGEDGSVKGLDLEKLKEEAPYLFQEEQVQGTGHKRTMRQREERKEVATTFRQALLRR